MLKKSIINLVTKSSAININNNNKDREYHVKKSIASYLVENTYKINLDDTARWRTVTLNETSMHLLSNCSGILIGPEPLANRTITNPYRILSAAHCTSAGGGGSEFTRFKKDFGPNTNNYNLVQPIRILGDFPANTFHDIAVYSFHSPNYDYIEHIKNIYVLENPEDIKEHQPIYKDGCILRLKNGEYSFGTSNDDGSVATGFFEIQILNYDVRLNQLYDGSATDTNLDGFNIDLADPVNNRIDYIRYIRNTIKKQVFFMINNTVPTVTIATPGDSGGPVFIPFGNDKLALIGMTSEGGTSRNKIKVCTVAPHINELETRYGLKIKRVRIDYEHNDLNDDIRNPGRIIICPENTGTLANPDDLYREFNRIK